MDEHDVEQAAAKRSIEVGAEVHWIREGHPVHVTKCATKCPFCKGAVIALPPDLLAAQPDDTTHACIGCGHGFAMGCSPARQVVRFQNGEVDADATVDVQGHGEMKARDVSPATMTWDPSRPGSGYGWCLGYRVSA